MMTSGGMLVRTRVADISVIGRNTQGVRLIRPKEDQALAAIAGLPEGPEADTVADNGEETT